jgi:hypothetical protein
MLAAGTERQRIDAAHGRQRKVAIKMREERATARDFPFEIESRGIDRDEQKIGGTGEMLRRRFRRLSGRREMDKAVLHIDGRTRESAQRLCGAPLLLMHDLVDDFRAPPIPASLAIRGRNVTRAAGRDKERGRIGALDR